MSVVDLLVLLNTVVGLLAKLAELIRRHPESTEELRAALEALEADLDRTAAAVASYEPPA